MQSVKSVIKRTASNTAISMRVFGISRIAYSILLTIAFSIICRTASSDNIASYSNTPIAVDSRLKTFVYSENEVFPVVLQYGFQTNIEFSKEETIQMFSLGNNYAWKISSSGRIIFIKPLEEGIMTNMIVRTNKRVYYFELISRPLSEGLSQDVAYAIRFFYPSNKDKLNKIADRIIENDGLIAQQSVINNGSIATQGNRNSDYSDDNAPKIEPYNFDYRIDGDKIVAPDVVFDDGKNTYFQYNKGIHRSYRIHSVDKRKALKVRTLGNYLVVNEVCDKFIIQSHIKGKSLSARIYKD